MLPRHRRLDLPLVYHSTRYLDPFQKATERHVDPICHRFFLAGIFHPAYDSGGCRLWIAGMDVRRRRILCRSTTRVGNGILVPRYANSENDGIHERLELGRAMDSRLRARLHLRSH